VTEPTVATPGPELNGLPSRLLLRRYTKLPVLINMLLRKRIEMSNPKMWEDANDRAYLEHYRRLEDLKSVFVLCFTTGKAMFHHWKVFAGCHCGVCIRYKPRSLARSFAGVQLISMGRVHYLPKAQVEAVLSTPAARGMVPFLKRTQFEDEREYRIVYGIEDEIDRADFLLHLDSIDSIVLSPWLSEAERMSVKRALRALPDCSNLKLTHSTTLSDRTWMNALRVIKEEAPGALTNHHERDSYAALPPASPRIRP
jgi:hypothetical protein